MGLVVPFRRRTKPRRSSEYAEKAGPSSDPAPGACIPAASGSSNRETLWEEEWIGVLEAALAARGSRSGESERRSERLAKFARLRQLVFFSPEIQADALSTAEPSPGQARPSPRWGDVFLRVDECYLFAFTVYASAYVQQCRSMLGEKINPSEEDVVLKCRHLVPRDILRAAMKWVNLYHPPLKGKPIFLEKEEILRELTRVPGAEILVATSLP
jgi:hypothetical protein